MNVFQTTYKKNQWSTPIPKSWDSPQTLVMVFFDPDQTKSDIWTELRKLLPESVFIGCSGAGSIKQTQIAENETVVTLAQFATTKLKTGSVDLTQTPDSFEAGRLLASQFDPENLRAIYVISDGLNVNGTALIQGMRKAAGEKVVIAGGLAGDGSNFKNTYVLLKGIPTEKFITAVAFYGHEIRIQSSAGGGWKSFGPIHQITSSKANVLMELDHKPALPIYKELMGKQAEKLPASGLMFPLHLLSDAQDENRNIVRTILGVDESAKSLTFAGDVPIGTKVQFMRTTREKLVFAAECVAQELLKKLEPEKTDDPVLSLVVSCVGRRLVLGEHTESELEATLELFPKKTIQAGFYSYGEIAPGTNEVCDLHNQTMTITLIQELDKAKL